MIRRCSECHMDLSYEEAWHGEVHLCHYGQSEQLGYFEQKEQLMSNNALDVQEGGSHYKSLSIQPIEYIQANNLGYIEGNIVKYATRHRNKNGAEDIKKIIHYCELLLELEYGTINKEERLRKPVSSEHRKSKDVTKPDYFGQSYGGVEKQTDN